VARNVDIYETLVTHKVLCNNVYFIVHEYLSILVRNHNFQIQNQNLKKIIIIIIMAAKTTLP
jgi:hypothetical protein